jgi:hypothetical protein
MTSPKTSIDRRLLAFQANTPDPRWSSHALNEFLSSVISEGGNIGNILQSLFSLLNHSQLSTELASFIKEVATCAFTSFHDNYQMSNLRWMQESITKGCTAPQAYLSLYSMPPELLNAECIVSLLKGLDGTPFWSEAVANLETEMEGDKVRSLLNDWLASGIQPQHRSDVERMVRLSY